MILFQEQAGIVYKADAFEILKEFQDNFFGMILTDPPYNISKPVVIKRGKGTKYKGKDIVLDFGHWDKIGNFDEYMEWMFSILDEMVRVLKPGRVIAMWFDVDSINFVSKYLQNKYDFKLKNYVAHIKQNPPPMLRKSKFAQGWEILGIWQKPGKDYVFNYQLGHQPNYFVVPVVSGKEKTAHPTQKPLKICSTLIAYFTNEGDTILDPFGGSGTTGVAAKMLGRKYVLIEKDEKYAKIIVDRIKRIGEQMKLI